MLSTYIHAAVAHERDQEFLAPAETDRRARLHRQGRGHGAETNGPAVPVIRHHRLGVGAELHLVGWEGGWQSWTPVFICR